MNHDRETAEVVELGKVSVETLGPASNLGDEFVGGEPIGLSTD